MEVARSVAIRRDLAEFSDSLSSGVARFTAAASRTALSLSGHSVEAAHEDAGMDTNAEEYHSASEESTVDAEEHMTSSEEVLAPQPPPPLSPPASPPRERAETAAVVAAEIAAFGKAALEEALVGARDEVRAFQQKLAGELSRFATSVLHLADDNDTDDGGADADMVVGLTDEVLEYAAELAEHPATWLAFPLTPRGAAGQYALTATQQTHARAVLAASAPLRSLARALCPRQLPPGAFWTVYFVLLLPNLPAAAAAALGSPAVETVRATLAAEAASVHHRRRRATSPTTTTDAEEPAEHAVGEAEEPEVLVDAHQVTSHQLAAHADGSALLLQEVAVAVPGRAVAMQVRVPAPPSPPPTEVGSPSTPVAYTLTEVASGLSELEDVALEPRCREQAAQQGDASDDGEPTATDHGEEGFVEVLSPNTGTRSHMRQTSDAEWLVVDQEPVC